MKLGYTIVYVPSPAEMLGFYERAFGLTRRFLHPSETYGELDTGETTLAFASMELAQSNFPDGVRPTGKLPANVEIAFVTPTVHDAWDAAVAAGAEPFVPPAAKPWGQIVGYVRDPAGTMIELCSPMGA